MSLTIMERDDGCVKIKRDRDVLVFTPRQYRQLLKLLAAFELGS